MVKREEIFDFVKVKYHVTPDYPWETYPNYAALRHQNNEKWFGLVMNVSSDKIGLNDNQEIDILNLKTREELIGPLRKKEGIYQAYHMNKSKWVSVNLNEMKSVDSIKELIDESYELTSQEES